MTRKVILEDKDGEELVPYTELATNQQPGRVRPDGSSLVVDSNGVISVSGATGTEIGYLSGVTSNIQGQLNTKTSPVDVNNMIYSILNIIWKVGSLYLDTDNSATCPMANLINGSVWELVAQDRALWGGDGTNANTNIEAGAPNITGSISAPGIYSVSYSTYIVGTGAFAEARTADTIQATNTSGGKKTTSLSFDASRSSTIYGNSSTIQPPSYRVNIWRRIA